MLDGAGSVVDHARSLAPDALERLRRRLELTLPRDAAGGIALGVRAWAVHARVVPGAPPQVENSAGHPK